MLQLHDLSNGSGVNPRHSSLADQVQVKVCFVTSFHCFVVYQRSLWITIEFWLNNALSWLKRNLAQYDAAAETCRECTGTWNAASVFTGFEDKRQA